MVSIIRKFEARKRFGHSHTTWHQRINDGLVPPPISLGGRAVGYISSELDAVMAALIAGKSESQIKEIVSSLVERRQDAISEVA